MNRSRYTTLSRLHSQLCKILGQKGVIALYLLLKNAWKRGQQRDALAFLSSLFIWCQAVTPRLGREGNDRQGGSVKVSSCPQASLKFARAWLPVLARLLSISTKSCTTELSLKLVMPATLTLKRKKRNGIGKKKGEVNRKGEEGKPPYFQ